MIVIVTGERDWLNKQQVWDELDKLFKRHQLDYSAKHPEETLSIEGLHRIDAAFILRHGVSGNVDFAANDWGISRHVTIERFRAEWRDGGTYNPGAGPMRNRKMAEASPKADLGLAFWSGKMRRQHSREYSGTLDCIQALLTCCVRVQIVPPKETT